VRATQFFLDGRGAGAPKPTYAIGASVDPVGEYVHSLSVWERRRDAQRHCRRNAGDHRASRPSTRPGAGHARRPRTPSFGLYGEEHPHRDVIGVGIFLREQDRPRFPHWANQAQTPLLQVALRRVLPDRLAREPDNPYVAVFAPLLIDDDDDLRARAQGLWRTVQEASLAPEIREILGQVLEFWFFERFRGLTAKEIWAMLNLVTLIQETKAYQSIFAEGEAKGEAKGKAEGKAESLKRLLARRFGPLAAWAEQRIDAAPVAQLDAWLDGIFDAAGVEDLIGEKAG
jgi:hypothetical protein